MKSITEIMENNKRFAPLIIIFLFSVVTFLKPTLFDMDSYYFAALACGKTAFRPDVDSFFTGIFFTHLTCSLLVFKLVLISIFTLCVILIEKIGELINKKYAHWLVFLLGSSLTFYSYFSKMEDDTLGLPFIFASLYFLVKWVQFKRLSDFIISLGICSICFLVWKGIAIWGIIVLAASPLTWILSGGILYYFSNELIPQFIPNVAEDLPIAGILANGLILVGALTLPSYFIPSVSLAFMFAIIKLKNALFLGILCGLGLYYYLCKVNFFEGDSKHVLGLSKHNALIAILIILNASSIIGIYTAPPSLGLINLAQTFSDQVKPTGLNLVYNDWEFGHLIRYNGLIPSHEYGPPTPSFANVDGFVLTRQTLNCLILESDENVYAYDCRK